MTEEYIREFPSQRIIGIIQTQSNGDQIAVDFITRKILGYYRKSLNKTTDFYGRILNDGNSLTALFYIKN